jgi:type IV secretory pathway VirB2 component (pilin)
MPHTIRVHIPKKTAQAFRRWIPLSTVIAAGTLPGGGSPFNTGFTVVQTLFTGTVAKVASLIAIVTGSYGFAPGEPGAKKR